MKNIIDNISLKYFNEQNFLTVVAIIVGLGCSLTAYLLHHFTQALWNETSSLTTNWYFPFIPAVGAALATAFLQYVTKEQPNHGVPEVIKTIAREEGILSKRTIVSKLVSSALTVGSGGSAGLEGPIVHSCASFGSGLGYLLNFAGRRRSLLVGCGSAAGIAAIFNAPIAGVIFTLEVIMDEFSSKTFVPIVISAVVATQISRILIGNDVAFLHMTFHIRPIELFLYIGLGLLGGVVSGCFIKLFYVIEEVAHKIKIHRVLKAFIGGLTVGVMGYFVPEVLGEGYKNITTCLNGEFYPSILIPIIIVVAKMVATSFTIASGGSGGMFGPCLVVGSFLGLFYIRVISTFSEWASKLVEGPYALVGMAALISGVIRAPLTAIFLIFETTGDYQVILPLMIVVVLSSVVSQSIDEESIYTKVLAARGDLIRKGTDYGVLESLKINDIIEDDCLSVTENMDLGEFVEIVKKSSRNYFPVVKKSNGKFVGIVFTHAVREYMFDPDLYHLFFVQEIMTTGIVTLDMDDSMRHVMDQFERTGAWSLPVLKDGYYKGMISKSTIFFRYRNQLIIQQHKK